MLAYSHAFKIFAFLRSLSIWLSFLIIDVFVVVELVTCVELVVGVGACNRSMTVEVGAVCG